MVLRGIVAVEEFVVAHKLQRVGEIVNVTERGAFGSRGHAVVDPVIASDQFEVVDQRKLEIQARELVGSLNPPAVRLKSADVVRFHPGMDVLTLELEVGTDVQRGIKYRRRPQALVIVVPGSGLARNPKFKIRMRFERIKPAQAATGT